jgi:integrase
MTDAIQTPVKSAPRAPRPKRRTGLGLYLDKKGRYCLDVVVHGHRLRKRYGGVPFQVAKQLAQRDALALRVSVLTTGGPPAAAPPVTDLTVAAALTRYEQEAFATLRPGTRRLARALMKPLRAHLGTVRLSALGVLDLERYRRVRTAPAAAGRGATGQVVFNRELALLSAVITRCQSWGLLSRTDNPCREVRRFKEPRGRERILSYAEEDALLAALPEPHRTVTQLALEVGARLQSELLPITWDDLDLDKARLSITATHAKNGRARHVPLSADMVQRLRAMQARSTSPFVFPAPRGGSFQLNFRKRYFPAVRAAGLGGTRVDIHCLRHTWASRMVEAGADLTLLMALGGWSSLVMVQRYSHHRPERAVDATSRMLAAREGATRVPPQTTPRPITAAPRTA